MGKVGDAYSRMEKAIDDFMDAIQDVIETTLPDDNDADMTYIEALYDVDSGEDGGLYQGQDSEWRKIAKDADSGALARKLREEYGDEE